MVKHNNQLPNNHFRKHWQERVKTWFDQAGRKKRRRDNRVAKAARVAPRPVDGLLRPVVRGQTLKYNTKVRAGRGFTFAELKEAGIRRREALTIGIAVDHRRQNDSAESLQANVDRLKLYKSKLILFPRKTGKAKKGDSEKAVLATASQLQGTLLPIVQPAIREKARTLTEEEKSKSQYLRLRKIQSDVRLAGKREKAAKAKAEAAAAAEKK